MADDVGGFAPDELEALLEKMQDQADSEGDDPKGGDSSEEKVGNGKVESEDDGKMTKLEEAITSLKTELEAQKRENAQSMGLLGQLMESAKGGGRADTLPQVPKDASPEDKRAAMEFALRYSPDLLGKLLEKDFEGVAQKKFEALESKLERKGRIRDLGNILSSGVLSHYEQEIQKPDSSLIRKAAQMKKELAGILDKEIVGSDIHDKLAIAIAAAASPDEVSKIHGSKQQAAEAARQEAIDRLGQLFGGGQKSYTRKVDEITDDDREIAEAWEMDLDDEDTRKELLARKRRAEDTYVAQNKVLGR